MGTLKCKIDKLDKKHKYKLETVLDIIMNLDYSNALSSIEDNLFIDSLSTTIQVIQKTATKAKK